MYYKVQDHLKENPNILDQINCPIKIPEEPEINPESEKLEVIDYWLKF